MKKEELLRGLPSVDRLLGLPELASLIGLHGRSRVADAAKRLVGEARTQILSSDNGGDAPTPDDRQWAASIGELIECESRPRLRKVVNCSGVVIHTNIGRSALSAAAGRAAMKAATSNVNLEYDLEEGGRGDRDRILENIITGLTGAEAATVVNNNAAAVLLTLNALSEGKETIVSRGELIEIGGSFRLPEIMAKSGCLLREVGTTNRTHLADYENAFSEKTALILQAHTSNYRIVGFTAQPGLQALAELAARKGVPLAVDLGSGTLAGLGQFGLPHEPTVQETLKNGADVVTISGDKLLGGPQAGIIAGRRELVDRINKNHLKRALRVDKMTVAALEATLLDYLDSEKTPQRVPTLRHLARKPEDMRPVAEKAAEIIRKTFGDAAEVTVIEDVSRAGSGSLPEVGIPTLSVAVRHKTMGPNRLADWFRSLDTPVIGRVEDNVFRLDMRCVEDAGEIMPDKTD